LCATPRWCERNICRVWLDCAKRDDGGLNVDEGEVERGGEEGERPRYGAGRSARRDRPPGSPLMTLGGHGGSDKGEFLSGFPSVVGTVEKGWEFSS